ncbi:DUF2946 family protein [Erythrobacter tepidarius]|uniref:DUF2946 family protein n=1 Tax=Erythrobacter tepidarius TaxID=60454 RepID=UPI000A3ABD08|nr:DUF2946 family protein [Erythrobacter tepidarius]
MPNFRAMIRGHAGLVLLLLALVLVVKAVVPSGFMLAADSNRVLTVRICSDASGAPKQMQIAIPGKHENGGDQSDAGGKAAPCAFSGLGQAWIGTVDPLLLASALVFILLLGLAPLPTLLTRDIPFLRPQLRGPPASV